jgi:hypothetical protein
MGAQLRFRELSGLRKLTPIESPRALRQIRRFSHNIGRSHQHKQPAQGKT